jgi:chromosome segregation ATPase
LQEELVDAEHETAEYTEREEVLRQKIEQIKAENQISLEELRTYNKQAQENLLNEIQVLKSKSINAGEDAHSNVEDEKKYKDLINELEFNKTEIEILRDQIEALEKSRIELEEAVEYQGGIAEDALQQVDEYEEELLYLRTMRDKFERSEIERQSLAESQQKPPSLNLKKSNIHDLYQ